MSAVPFDTHKVAKTLAKAGFNEPQVEAQVEVLTEFSSELATKKDLDLLESRLTTTMWKMQLATIVLTIGGVFALLQFMLPPMISEAVMQALGK